MIDDAAYIKLSNRVKELELTLNTLKGKVGNSSLDLISYQIAGVGGLASFDFQNIPAVYSKLIIDIYARGDTAAVNTSTKMTFNGDTSTLYDSYFVDHYGAASLSAAAELFAARYITVGFMAAATGPANTFDIVHIEIIGYTSTNGHKTALTVGTLKHGTVAQTIYTTAASGWYRSLNVINRVTLTPAAGNFVQYSHASLYGVYG